MSQQKSSKLPNNYTLEELLESINNPQSSSEELSAENTTTILELLNSDVYNFITTLNLQSGKQLVKKRILYTIYRSWSIRPVSFRIFSTFLQTVFDHNQKHYKLNIDTLKLLRMPIPQIQKVKKKMTTSKNYKAHFDAFLNHYDITAGTFYVKSFVLYYLYDLWTYKNKSLRPLGFSNFLKFCDVYFVTKRLEDSKIKYYGISENIKETHLTKERLDEIHQWGKKFNENKVIGEAKKRAKKEKYKAKN